jgi:hypothetical protein
MNVMILGPAGCGKSLLTEKFGAYLEKEGYSVKYVNLDPGCSSVSYECSLDVREIVTVEEIMRREKMGPNSAMIRVMEKLEDLRIPSYKEDFVLLDTPGQLEIFSFHACGPKIVSQLEDPVGIFILDASIGVKDLPAMYLYSLATRYRLGINAVNIVNKADLISPNEKRMMEAFLSNPLKFEEVIRTEGVLMDIYSSISELLHKVLPAQRIPFVSARTGMGFSELLDILYEIKCSCGDLT